MCSFVNGFNPSSFCRRWTIASSGVGRRPVCIRPPLRTPPCSPARRRCWALKNSGRPKRRTSVVSLCGLFSMAGAGPLREHSATASATTRAARSATKALKLWITCPYAREVWFKALRRCGWQGLTPTMTDCFTEWWLRSRKRIPKERRKAFDFFVILDAWCLWLERNVRVFEGRASSSTAQLGSLWSLLFSGIVN
jgi:hypothetical protein